MRTIFAAAALAVLVSQAHAACPGSAPKNNWNMHSADQAVGEAFLKKTLAGKRVQYKFDGSTGTEQYKADGSYAYKLNRDVYSAPDYRFYSNGVRCIGYDNPRYDRYVVNGGKLVLINTQGGRFEGRLMK